MSSLAVGGLDWSQRGQCFVESTETTCSRLHDFAFHGFHTSKATLCLHTRRMRERERERETGGEGDDEGGQLVREGWPWL